MVNFHRAVIGQHEGIITFLGDLGLSAPPESFYSKRLQAIPSIAIASVCCVSVWLWAPAICCGVSIPPPCFWYFSHILQPLQLCHKNAFFWFEGCKKCHFLVCGVRKKWKSWKSSERVGNEVKSFTVLVGNLPHIMPWNMTSRDNNGVCKQFQMEIFLKISY